MGLSGHGKETRMNGNTILIALGGAILIALYQIKQYQNFFKFIDAYKAQHKVDVRHTGRTGVDWSGLVVAAVLFAALSVYTFLNPDTGATTPQNFLLMAAVLLVIFGSSALTSGTNTKVYYTTEGFFLKGLFIPFSQIKGFERSQRGQVLRLTDDSTHIVTPQQVVGLDELRKQGFYKLDLD